MHEEAKLRSRRHSCNIGRLLVEARGDKCHGGVAHRGRDVGRVGGIIELRKTTEMVTGEGNISRAAEVSLW